MINQEILLKNQLQAERARKVRLGDTVTLNPEWNRTAGKAQRLPDRLIVRGIKLTPGSQTGISFSVGPWEDNWLDSGWFNLNPLGNNSDD